MPNCVDNPELFDSIKLAGKKSPGLATFTAPPTRDEGWDKQTAKGSKGSKLVHNETPAIDFEVELLLWKDEGRDCFAEWDKWKPVLLLSSPHPETAPASPASIGANPKVQAARTALLAVQTESQKFRPTSALGTREAQIEILTQQKKLADAQAAMNKAVKGASTVSQPKRVAIDIYHPQLAGLNPPVTSVVVKSWTEPAPQRGRKTGSAVVRIKFIESREPSAVGAGAVNGSRSNGGGSQKSTANDPNADLKARVKGLTAEFQRP